MFGCSFFLSHLEIHTLKSKTRLQKYDHGNSWFLQIVHRICGWHLATRELFSFHVFEQMENSFTDKRRRERANAQQAAGPRLPLSLLAACWELRLFVWRGGATTQPCSTEKQVAHTQCTWMSTKMQNTKDVQTTILSLLLLLISLRSPTRADFKKQELWI